MVKRKRSHINLSRNNKLTVKAGSLIPVMCEKVLPNDIIGGKLDMVIRVAPQIAPVLDGMKVKSYFFYCPTRLLDPRGEKSFEDWFTKQGSEIFVSSRGMGFGEGSTSDTAAYYENADRFSKGVYNNYFAKDSNNGVGGYTNPEYSGYRYGDGDYTNSNTFRVPVEYPHFDVTLPKVYLTAGDHMTDESTYSDVKDSWLGSVPYRDVLAPYFTEIGSLADYFGVCVGEGKWGDKINPFPFLMYRKVFNEFFVDPLKRDLLPEKLYNYSEIYSDLFSDVKLKGFSTSIGSDFVTNSENPVLVRGRLGNSNLQGVISPTSIGVFGLENPTNITGEYANFGFISDSAVDIASRYNLKNCYPLIDPYVLGLTGAKAEYWSNEYYRFYDSQEDAGFRSFVDYYEDQNNYNFFNIFTADYTDQYARKYPRGSGTLLALNDFIGNPTDIFMNLGSLIFKNMSTLLTYAKDGNGLYNGTVKKFRDSDLSSCGQKLASNYSIFNDLLYKPAKRNIWNTCICDPSLYGEKFICPVDSIGSQIDISDGGTEGCRLSGLDVRELKVYSRIGLFFNYLAYTGDKYEDQLRMIYGTRPSDLRMKKPKFIGSGSSSIVFSEIINTSGTAKTTTDSNVLQQGTSTGYAFGMSKRHGFKYHAKEEGYVLGLICIEPRGRDIAGRPTCLNVPKSYYDIPNPFIDGIGNQEVLVRDFMPHKFMGLYNVNFSPNGSYTRFTPNSGLISGYASDYSDKFTSYSSYYLKNLSGSVRAYFCCPSSFETATDKSEINKLIEKYCSGFLSVPAKTNFMMTSKFFHDAVENKTFGYQKQYFDYRHAVPEVHGEYLLQKRSSHLSRFFNEFIPDIDRDCVYTNDNNHFGAEKYIGIGRFATDMLGLDSYRYNTVDRLFELQAMEHPFWLDINVKCGVSRIISKRGGVSLV